MMRKPIDQKIDRAGALFHVLGLAMALFALSVGCASQTSLPQPIPYISRVMHLPVLDREEAEEQTAPGNEDPVNEAEAAQAIKLVPANDPMLTEARIRGVSWPMVYNNGSTFAHHPQVGLCSYYNEDQPTATGERFNPEALTAAHRSLPFGTIVRCTRTDTGDAVIVVINDRGPFKRGRIIDLSRHAAEHVGLIHDGVAPCKIEILAYPLIEAMGPKGNG